MTTSHPTPGCQRSRASRLAVVLAVVAVLGSVVATVAGAATRDELQETRDRIEDTLDDLRAVDAEATQTAEQVAAAEERVAALEAELNDLLSQLQAQEERVVAARARAEEAVGERDRIRDAVGERARRAFMGATSEPLLLLGGQDIDDVSGALDGLALLGAVNARADASMETLDVVRVRSETAAARLAEEVAVLEDVRVTRETLLQEAEVVLAARAEALAGLEAESDRLLAEQEQLEAEEAELQQLIRRQEQAARRAEEERRRAEEAAEEAAVAPAAAPPPPSSSGCYAWPASGPVTSEYGPRWGRMHKGLDVDGDTGDPLYAAQSGTVTYTGYYSGYGNLTLIRHSDGITTAYAHQSSFGVSTGQTVARGEYIGAMGATGNVTGSHLHFETRTSGGAVNPRNYLC